MRVRLASMLSVLVLTALAAPGVAGAHCDTLDGPVVIAGRSALEDGKLAPVLAWVRAADEGEIRAAFTSARAARKSGKEAREVADRWFLETLVRVHRAGEGAPYTGLKPAGAVDPAVAAADRAVAGGDAKTLEKLLVDAVRSGLHENVARLRKERPPADDVAAGRRWVAAYVPLVHWVEGVYAAAGADLHAAHAGHAGGAADAGHAGHPAKQGAADEPKHGGHEAGHAGHGGHHAEPEAAAAPSAAGHGHQH